MVPVSLPAYTNRHRHQPRQVRQQSLVKLGLDYAALQQQFPALIYGHLSAFGRAGPQQHDPGYDFGAFWAQSGLMDIVRSSDDAPMPRYPGGVGDNLCGMQLVGGIFAALFHKQRTGEGQLVDACLLRTGLWMMGYPMSMLAGGNSYATEEGQQSAWGGIRETTAPGERKTLMTQSPFKCKVHSTQQQTHPFLALSVPPLHLPRSLWTLLRANPSAICTPM